MNRVRQGASRSVHWRRKTLEADMTAPETRVPETLVFEDDGVIPNSRLPLLVYRAALAADPEAIEQRFASNGWRPAWRDGVHPFHHFHANTHEALGVARGEATILFGGPGGRKLHVSAGDIVIVPAGVGHCNTAQSRDLLIVGAYPDDAPPPDQYRGNRADHETVVRKVSAVPVPLADPVTGSDGPLRRLWGTATA
jgi:uncharacterized protein YjlB